MNTSLGNASTIDTFSPPHFPTNLGSDLLYDVIRTRNILFASAMIGSSARHRPPARAIITSTTPPLRGSRQAVHTRPGGSPGISTTLRRPVPPPGHRC
ncbi:hypothetical protein ACRAWF_47120 [Streptomyces sp. L7]